MARKKLNETVVESEEINVETAKLPKWTIIIYMAGDNNLSEDMITPLKDLKVFAGNRDVNVVALYDTNYPPKRAAVYDFTKCPKTNDLNSFEVENAVFQILNKPIPSATEPDVFDPDIEFIPLKMFVPWVLKQPKFKANNYALILSGHSDGILGKTMLRDDNPPTSMDLKTLGRVLEFCRRKLKTSNPRKEKFDLLGFDSCLMGMLEAAYEIKDTANYMVSSEGNIPNSGWNYAAVLKELYEQNGKLDAEHFARSIVKSYTCYNADFIPSGRSINISAFNLSETERFAHTFNLFAGFLLRILKLRVESTEEPSEVEKYIKNAVVKQKFINYVLQAHYYSQTFMHEQSVDIMDFAKYFFNGVFIDLLMLDLLMKNRKREKDESFYNEAETFNIVEIDTATSENYKNLHENYRRFIIATCFAGAEYQFSKGVSVFFPWSQMPLKMIFSEYRKLKFNRKFKKWKKFIRKYVELTNRTPETQLLFNLEDYKKLHSTFEENLNSDKNKKEWINFLRLKLTILFNNEDAGKQYIGKQYIGKQYIGKGDAFYDYFSQIRNYSPFELDDDGKEVGLIGCLYDEKKDEKPCD